jgi:hypothetical protein
LRQSGHLAEHTLDEVPDGVGGSLRSAWAFDAIRRKTAQGPYEAVNYHRFADDMVITFSGHHTKLGWRNAPCNVSRNSLRRWAWS